MNIVIRDLQREHVLTVVGIVRRSFELGILPFMIYGQQGIESFIADSLPRLGASRSRSYLIAIDANTGEALGFADFDTRNRTAPHLGYICVTGAAQGQGVATSLINHFLSEHPFVQTLTLDVFEQSAAARSLYRKLGFSQGACTTWYERELPAASQDGEVTISNLPNLVAAHKRFGFSMAEVDRNSGTHLIGRLGEGVLRTNEPEVFSDDGFLSGLRRVFPNTQSILLISNTEPSYALSTSTRRVLRSVRMQLNRLS